MGKLPFDTNPPLKTLRQFGALWLLAFGVVSVIAARGGRPTALVVALAAAAVLVPLVGWFVPPVLRGAWIVLSAIAWPIGTAVSLVILSLVWLVVMTPIGLATRLLGYDPLGRRADPAAASYWFERPRDAEARGNRRYFRQF